MKEVAVSNVVVREDQPKSVSPYVLPLSLGLDF